jgi:hypothetical protein
MSDDRPVPTLALLTIFAFHTDDVWLNLHQFLYVLGRHEALMPDRTRRAQVNAPDDADKGLATLTPEEQRVWREAVTFYAQDLSKLDAIFDDRLVGTASAIAAAGNRAALDGTGVDPSLAAVLEKVAPIYRKAWWPAHERANRAWTEAMESLVTRHGEAILKFITGAYGLPWPADGFPIHISGYANWAGAFSTSGNLLIISSLDPGNGGMAGLEGSFHEAMHQWDRSMFEALAVHARKQGKKLPNGLTHALIWMTAAAAVRSVAPSHAGYADENGLWRGPPLAALKPILDEVWMPYLNGKGTRDEALAAIVTRLQ